jgi:8-oxo-dGTP pyrophosphatase MutT (NUDIX family)
MGMSEYMRRLRARVGADLIELPSVSVVTFDDAGRVLIIRHGDVQRWEIPGGQVDPQEPPADAAVREMWEETGLHVELTRIVGVYGGRDFTTTYSNGDVVSFVVTVFEGRPVGGALRVDGTETLEARWVGQGELAGLTLSPWVGHVLGHAFADRTRVWFDAPAWRPPGR